MKRRLLPICGLFLVALPAIFMGQAKMTDADATQASTDIVSTDPAVKAAALEKINGWVKSGTVSISLWRVWIPQLIKDGKNQEVADLSLTGLLFRPDPPAIVALMQFRYQALGTLKKNDEALMAAKSYYNIVEMKNTTRGVDAIATALGRAHPEDLEIVRKFRAEQLTATADKPLADDSLMKSIKIDRKPYESQLKIMQAKTVFRDRIAYGDLLLASDQGAEAEKIFREVYQTAEAGDQLNQATEGIAKAIRAQDGNSKRADAWFKVAQEQAATQAAATAAAPRPTTAAAATPATKPKVDPNLP